MRAYFMSSLLVVPVFALANGGPVAWSSPTGRGDVSPTTVNDVRLVSETLKITIDDGGDRYSVDAAYVLENSSSKALRVTYGVPLTWVPDSLPDEDWEKIGTEQALKAKGLQGYPDSIEIRIDGKRSPCKLEGVKKGPMPPGEESLRFEGWCVAELEVPPTTKSSLSLRYPGSFEFTDWAYSKSPFKVFAKRRLEYLLSPAAGWRGPPDVVDIELDAGRWADDVEDPSPPVSVRKGSKLRWHLVKPDLRKLSALVVVIDGKKKREFRDRLTLDAPDRRVSAGASSTLPPQGRARYDAANLLDGDERTAWCASRAESRGRPWIELKASNFDLKEYCGLVGFTLVPGYARDQETYRRNNRIAAVRLASCGENGGEIHEVTPAKRADESFIDLEAPDDMGRVLRETKSMCVRLIIEKVELGPDEDTCVSEFRPVINCG